MPEMTFDDLQHLLWAFARHRVVTVAARSGILNTFAESSATTDDVAEALELDPSATGKVIRALHAMGLLEAQGERYAMVTGLRPFFERGPGDLTAFMEHSHTMYDGWGENLEGWLRGEPWHTGQRDAESTRRFGAAMRAIGSIVTPRVAGHIDLDGVSSMLDVGGGFGQYSVALCDRSPGLRATVLDIPPVTAQAARELAGTPFENRISFIGGDYLEADYGTDYELVLLANILHQESAQRAAELVRRAAQAVNPGGRVVVVDFRIDDERRNHPLGTLFAINMRSFGDTYTEPEISTWMTDAGLEDITRTDIDEDRWLITGRKPEPTTRNP